MKQVYEEDSCVTYTLSGKYVLFFLEVPHLLQFQKGNEKSDFMWVTCQQLMEAVEWKKNQKQKQKEKQTTTKNQTSVDQLSMSLKNLKVEDDKPKSDENIDLG